MRKRLRIDAIHPLTERSLPIFVSMMMQILDQKYETNMPMLNVQIGKKECNFDENNFLSLLLITRYTVISNSFDESFANKHNDFYSLIDSSTHWYKMDLETLLAELRSRQLGGYRNIW